ncbi:MAG: FAD-dependent monooxygenase [Micromonosporaceae bacterium]|nr:FAD-dependent monooxygenase [Micromonosporaceae bacterium]
MAGRGRGQTPVLIVGAGPVGAVTALTLARYGVPSTVVDRSVLPSAGPTMDVIDGRSMELLRQLGLADRIRAVGIDSHHSLDVLWTRGFTQPPVLVWHCPSVDQMRRQYAAVNDGTAPVEPYQRVLGSVVERLLRQEAAAHPLIDVWPGSAVTAVEATADQVTATVVDRAGRRTITADYLVACDGARSIVRRFLGIDLDPAAESSTLCSVDFRSRDRRLRQYGRAFVTIATAGLTLISRDEYALWTATFPVDGPGNGVADPLAEVQRRLGIGFTVDDLISVVRQDATLAVASTFRAGRVFLAGDAAHPVVPTGVYGASPGIGDAVDLGWKLAGVVNGWAGPRLLDSYEAERRPVALLYRELCADLLEVGRRFGRLAAAGVSPEQLAGFLEVQAHHIDNLGVHFGHRYVGSPVVVTEPGEPPLWSWSEITGSTWPGGRAPSVRLSSGEQLFDRFGPGFTLLDISGYGLGRDLVDQAARRSVPITYLAIDDRAVRACYERQLVLVRPDHYVGWRSDYAPVNWGEILDVITGQGCAVGATGATVLP